MKNLKKFWIIAGGSALLVLCIMFGAFFAGPLLASAHGNQATAGTPAANKAAPYCNLYNQSLAQNLGVTTDKLHQARGSALTAVLNQMVKDGKLTQAQATKIEQAQAKNTACRGFNGYALELRVVYQYLRAHRADIIAQVAQGLNMKPADLTAQLKSGKSLDDIATAQKVQHSQLVTIVTNAVNSTVSKGESSGVLTQDQVAAFQTFMKNHPNLINRLSARHWNVKKTK